MVHNSSPLTQETVFDHQIGRPHRYSPGVFQSKCMCPFRCSKRTCWLKLHLRFLLGLAVVVIDRTQPIYERPSTFDRSFRVDFEFRSSSIHVTQRAKLGQRVRKSSFWPNLGDIASSWWPKLRTERSDATNGAPGIATNGARRLVAYCFY